VQQTHLYTLGKKERLKSRKQIEQLFKEGNSFAVKPLRVYFMMHKQPPAKGNWLQFGVGVGTKHFKKAVDRNRIKRLIREAYRLQKNKLKTHLKEKKAGLNVFFIFTGKELPEYDLIFNKTGLALEKLLKEAV
jgi:ribonuclease P protein component